MIRGCTLRQWVAGSALGLCALAHAQTAPDASASAPSGALPACESATFDRGIKVGVPPGMTVPPQGVVVRVLLEFQEVNADPTVTTTFNSGDQAFADAVMKEARTYRLPCVKKGDSPLRYEEEVQFVGGETPKIIWGPIRPERRAASRSNFAGCFKSADGGPLPPWREMWGGRQTGSNINKPQFPDQGLVLVALTFRSPDLPPDAKVLFRSGDPRLEAPVLEYVASHRWKCMKAGDPPFETVQSFRFQGFDDSPPTPTKGSLQQFLGIVDKLSEQKVRFDFTTMGCPFSFRLNYVQPFMPNRVMELGAPNPNRREFVEWLRQVKAKPELNPDNKLVDRDFDVSVPCLVLDLT